MIYISHRLGEIKEIAHRVVALRDGQNAGELLQDEIKPPAMVKLMVGRDIAPPHATDTQKVEGSVPRLKAENLRTERYPDRPVSFELFGGEVLGFAGLVGAGRTEIARALFGVEPALGGTITLDGTPTRINKPSDAIKRGLYLIPEDRRRDGLILDMPIADNITLPGLAEFASAIGLVKRDREKRSGTTRNRTAQTAVGVGKTDRCGRNPIGRQSAKDCACQMACLVAQNTDF